MRFIALALFTIGMATVAGAAITAAPEIDPGMGANALALLSGAILVIRSRRK
jgi:hypothetical protein